MHRRNSPGGSTARPPLATAAVAPAASTRAASQGVLSHVVTAVVTVILCALVFAVYSSGGGSDQHRPIPPASNDEPPQPQRRSFDATLAPPKELARSEPRRVAHKPRRSPAPPTLVPPERIAEMIARSQQGDTAHETPDDVPERAPHVHDESQISKPSLIPNRRWQYSNLAAPLPPRDAELHRKWKAAEPGFEHVVLRDEQCDRALEKFFPKVPRGASSMSFALRSVVCGLVAVWHDGGYYVHRDVAPAKPFSDWLVNRTGPSEIVASRSGHDVMAVFFGAVKQQRCVAAALEAVAELPGEALSNQHMPRTRIGFERYGVDQSVLMPLVSDDCGDVRFDLPISEDELKLPEVLESPTGGAELFIWSEKDTGPAVPLDDVPPTFRRWALEEGPQPARVDDKTCAVAMANMRPDVNLTVVAKGVAATEPELYRSLCGLMQMQHVGGIVIARNLTWARPTALWVPPSTDLAVVADAAGTSFITGFFVSIGSSPCSQSVVSKALGAWAQGNAVEAAAIHAAVFECGTVLPTTVAQGDGFRL